MQSSRRDCSLVECRIEWAVQLTWVNCRLVTGGTWSFPLGRLCAGLLTQHPDKEGAFWDGKEKEGETPPLGMSLTKVYRRICYFSWKERMWPGLCRMCYHLIASEDLPQSHLVPLCCTAVWITFSLFRNKYCWYLALSTLPCYLCF